MMAKLPFDLRFSLGEALLLAIFAGIGLAALRMGDRLAATVTFLALLAAIVAAVVAVSADGAARRFATCFLIGAAVYGAVVWSLGTEELDPVAGRLLSTRAMEPVQAAMVESSYFEIGTGIPATIAERDEARKAPLNRMQGGGNQFPQFSVYVGGRHFFVQETPRRDEFMRVAHVLWGLLIAYASGKLGSAIYRRRRRLAADGPTAGEIAAR